MINRLKQRQRQQRSTWAMLNAHPHKFLEELNVGDYIALKDEYDQGLLGRIQIIEDLGYEFVCCAISDKEIKSRVLKSYLQYWRRV